MFFEVRSTDPHEAQSIADDNKTTTTQQCHIVHWHVTLIGLDIVLWHGLSVSACKSFAGVDCSDVLTQTRVSLPPR